MKQGHLAISLALVFLAAAAHAETAVLELDPAQTKVNFTLGDILHTVHGAFKLKHGTIRYDPATGAASGELVVDATSGNSGSEGRDRRMHRNILESAKYPEITFVPDRVVGTPGAASQSPVQLHGMFRIHGAEHELVLPVKAQVGENQFSAATTFTVPYVKWGMKNPSTFFLRVSDKVEISIDARGRVVHPTVGRGPCPAAEPPGSARAGPGARRGRGRPPYSSALKNSLSVW